MATTETAPAPRPPTVTEHLHRLAGERPDDVAVTGADGNSITFAELWDRSCRMRAHLEGLGVGPGDRVALVAVTSIPAAIAVWGTIAAGAVAVPLNYRLPAADLGWLIADAEARALLGDARALEALAGHVSDLPTVCLDAGADPAPAGCTPLAAALATEPAEAQRRPHHCDLDDPAFVLYTSGTTARPKGVLQAHRGYAATAAVAVPLPPEWVNFLHCVPIYHLAGLGALTVQTARGCRYTILERFTPDDFLRTVERHGCNMTFLVPTMMCDLVEHDRLDDHDRSSLKIIVYGSAPTPIPVLVSMIERFPCLYTQLYSQTEGTTRVTMLGPEDHALSSDPAEREVQLRRLGSIGKVMEGSEVRICDEQGAAVPTGEVGELWYRTPGNMRGYLGRDDATRETMRDGWIVSGDKARIDEDGYVYLVGRAKDFLIRGGENIAPREIEEALESHPAVAEAAVVGRPDPRWGEVPVAFVRCPDGLADDDLPGSDELRAHCRDRLAGFKVPEQVWVRRELPRNHMGKILKRELALELARPAPPP